MSGHEHHGHDHHGHDHDHADGAQVGYASPAEAMQAPAEEFVYVACLQKAPASTSPTSWPSSTSTRDSDTYGQITHRTPMPASRRRAAPLRLAGLRVGLPQQSASAPTWSCPASAPAASTSSMWHSDPRKPTDQQGHRAGGDDQGRPATPRPHTVHCMPGGIVTISMLGDAERRRAGRLRRPRRLQLRRARPLGERQGRHGSSPTTSGTSRARTSCSPASGPRPTPSAPASTWRTCTAGKYGHSIHIWDLGEARQDPDDRPGRDGHDPARRSAGCTTPRPRRASSARRSPARCCTCIARAAGWAVRQGGRGRAARRSPAGPSPCRA